MNNNKKENPILFIEFDKEIRHVHAFYWSKAILDSFTQMHAQPTLQSQIH